MQPQTLQRSARPCRLRCINERAALCRRFQEPFLRGHEGRGQFGDHTQRGAVVRRASAMGMDEKTRIAKAAAFAEHHGEPSPQRSGILDVAGFDRPFEAARVRKSADRVGGRKPPISR